MLVALITDTHWGVRNDSTAFAAHFNKFYDDIFFPYLKENNIKKIWHLGDIVDRRKHINFVTARHLRNFVETCHTNDIALDVIVGNHDTSFKNTNEVNAMHELFCHSKYDVNYHSVASTIDIDGTKIAILPWVCTDNYAQSMQFLKDTPAQILFGHLEIQGFEMYRGAVNDHGFETSVFSKFEMVLSGHFHHKSSKGNITYLGAPYQMTWSDYNDPRGFHILNTETRELTYIQNPYTMFNKVFYSDASCTFEELMDIDVEKYKGSYVKVIVQAKTNPYWFDLFIDKLEKAEVLDIQVVDDNLNLNTEEEMFDETEDTLTILKKYVEQIETSVDRSRLNKFLGELYVDAINVE